MEPLLDKLARLKPVRLIFDTIRDWDKQSNDWAKVRAKISTILAIVGLLFGPFVLYTVWPLSVWLLGANDDHPFPPETGTWVSIIVGVASGLFCLLLLPIPFKVRLWITLPYILLFGWLLLWFCMFPKMMFFGFSHPKNDTVSFLRFIKRHPIRPELTARRKARPLPCQYGLYPMEVRTTRNSIPFRCYHCSVK